MKNLIKSALVLAVVAFASISFTALNETKPIKTSESSVVWKGYKVTGSHQGNIALKAGTLEFKNNILAGGSFVIDMTTINTTDLEGDSKNNLDGHLKSDDFFGVKNFPEAKLEITKVTPNGKNAYSVESNLTIKGKTNTQNFTMSVYGNKATANLKVDRTKYDIKYGSASFMDGLKDKAIYDDFDLNVDLVF
jgi:polyisoprenoid-binding protein YceI